MNHIINILRGSLLAGFILATALGLHLHHQAYKSILQEGENVTFTISKGSTYREVIATLQENDLARGDFYLWIFSKWMEAERKIKAGTYLLEGPIGTVEMLHRLIDGHGKILQKQVLLEGWTIQEMIDSMERSDIIEAVERPWRKLGFESIEDMEGQCMPDTYFFERGSRMTDIFQQCTAAMRETLEKLWLARSANLPYQNMREALTLASIVEMETNLDRERKQVAGVLVSRLRKNIRLQADPTVIYGLGEDFDNNLKRSHLRQDPSVNQYNTYQLYGLPPGPISNPGRKSLIAALHPDEKEGYLYYVSKGDGSHYFSKSYKEHKRAVRKYQLRR